jgi:hypothetical protein
MTSQLWWPQYQQLRQSTQVTQQLSANTFGYHLARTLIMAPVLLWCWLVGCGAGLLAVGQLWYFFGQLWCWLFGCGGVWWAVVLAGRLLCWSVNCGNGRSAVVLARTS